MILLYQPKHTAMVASSPAGPHGNTAEEGRSERQRKKEEEKAGEGCVCVWGGSLLDTDTGSWPEWP